MPRRRLILLGVAVLGVFCFLAYLFWKPSADPNALWAVVQSCVAQNKAAKLVANVCIAVDQKDHVAVLRSIEGREQFLLVPTIKVTGIEDPYILKTSAPNYFALAWSAGERYLPDSVRNDRTRIALAINSVYGRSQNQLHIHISCVDRRAAQILAGDESEFGTNWSAPDVQLGEHEYRVLRIWGANLGVVNPFRLVAGIDGASRSMGYQTLVLIGARFDGNSKPGFFLLDDFAHDTPSGFDRGYGEGLLDENCGSPGSD